MLWRIRCQHRGVVLSENAAGLSRTEHAMLVLLGQYAQHLGLIQALMDVALHQKTYLHSPQTKLLEFLVAILAGLPHLEDISQDARPLDQDRTLAYAWQQADWAKAPSGRAGPG